MREERKRGERKRGEEKKEQEKEYLDTISPRILQSHNDNGHLSGVQYRILSFQLSLEFQQVNIIKEKQEKILK